MDIDKKIAEYEQQLQFHKTQAIALDGAIQALKQVKADLKAEEEPPDEPVE